MSWIGGLFERETLPVLEASMGMAAQRQLVLANNIANVDTPHYRRQVLPEKEFHETLVQAIDERERYHWNRFEAPPRFGLRWNGAQVTADVRRGVDQGPVRHDEVNVNIEKEMGDMAKNVMYMTALQRLFKTQTQQMMSALRDRVA